MRAASIGSGQRSAGTRPYGWTRRQRWAGGPVFVSVPENVAVHSQAVVVTVTVNVPRCSTPLRAQPSVSAWCQTARSGEPAIGPNFLQPGSFFGGVSRHTYVGV